MPQLAEAKACRATGAADLDGAQHLDVLAGHAVAVGRDDAVMSVVVELDERSRANGAAEVRMKNHEPNIKARRSTSSAGERSAAWQQLSVSA